MEIQEGIQVIRYGVYTVILPILVEDDQSISHPPSNRPFDVHPNYCCPCLENGPSLLLRR